MAEPSPFRGVPLAPRWSAEDALGG